MLPVRPGYDQLQPYPPRNTDSVDGVTIHYTASPPSTPIINIARYQTGPQSHEPFPAIAYHLMIDEVGDVHLLHDLDRRVWHSGAPGANDTKVGICYIGDTEPNDAQIRGIKQAIDWSEDNLGRPLTVGGHKDNYATQCPGPTWHIWRNKLA